jgi:hypothetical protein
MEGDRLFELAGEMGQRLTHVLRDVVPPEAQVHLVNAQREVLAALFIIYEHQIGIRRPHVPVAPPATTPTTPRRRASATRRPRPRVERIEIE